MATDESRAIPGENVLALNDGREITRKRRWIAVAVVLLLGVSSLGQPLSLATPYQALGGLAMLAVVYWLALRLLSRPADPTD